MNIISALVVCFALLQTALHAAPPVPETSTSQTTKVDTKKNFDFTYSQAPVIDIINQLAAQKEVNVIFPVTEDLSKLKITYKNPTKMTINEAWQKLIEILEFLSLTFKKIDNDTVTIVKIDKRETTARQTWPLYIDVPFAELPDTEDVIRAIFYLHNISVKDQKSTLQTILIGTGANATGMLSLNADVQFDEKTNGIIITDKATYIQSAMQLIKELDLGGLRDAIEVVPLYYTSANFIATIIKELLPQAPTGGTNEKANQTPYFPKNTRVAALDRNNAIVIMGSPHGIDVTKDFIVKYLDLPAELGESIIHVYNLQYLDATKFAPILDQLVQQQTGGAQATGEKKTSGPQRYFKEVIIAAETIEKPVPLKPQNINSYDFGSYTRYNEYHPQRGGNRLIIAARKQDWLRIEKLIKDLDKPQPQVGIEILIVDVTVDKTKILGSQFRNKQIGSHDSLGKSVNYQSAQLNNVVLEQSDGTTCDGGTRSTCMPGSLTADSLQANLLLVAQNLAGASSGSGQTGMMLISLTDGKGLYNVWQVLDSITPATILSQPYLTTTNNAAAIVMVGQDKLLPDAASVQGVSTVIKNKSIPAFISVSVQPRISLTNNINMLVAIKIENYIGTTTDRQERNFTTSANVGNGEVLVLGGLTQRTGTVNGNETPILGQIPVVGWLFKRLAKDKLESNLLVFIRPIILEPRKDGVTNEFSQHKFNIARSNLQDHMNTLHDNRDPISRWFFKPERAVTPGAIDDYIDETQHRNLEAHVSHAYQELERPGVLRSLVQNEENPLLRTQQRS